MKKIPPKIQLATDLHSHVACPSCGAGVGEPCRSCLDNPTYPHTARVTESHRVRAVTAAAAPAGVS